MICKDLDLIVSGIFIGTKQNLHNTIWSLLSTTTFVFCTPKKSLKMLPLQSISNFVPSKLNPTDIYLCKLESSQHNNVSFLIKMLLVPTEKKRFPLQSKLKLWTLSKTPTNPGSSICTDLNLHFTLMQHNKYCNSPFLVLQQELCKDLLNFFLFGSLNSLWGGGGGGQFFFIQIWISSILWSWLYMVKSFYKTKLKCEKVKWHTTYDGCKMMAKSPMTNWANKNNDTFVSVSIKLE